MTGTSAFTAVQWAIGGLLFDDVINIEPSTEQVVDGAGCLPSSYLQRPTLEYVQRQMRCALVQR